ncbi:hypothetical protein NQ314_017078 [Rhamnusium bicolor]|uniref:Uncharacterized protein n=1 Tax=Rhamnusium bicolor TaxID=1586634 RepID=A0AAV8WUF6_9CUCU|nr:hypothetical protein NQ314_017078 [Rhamnusium bicolor]
MTPATRRHKNQSFAIIGEVDRSRPNSRSPSPTGRVSPFRGHGFNPSGSRHASPNPSPPPPEDARLTPTNMSPRHISKIPQLKRKVSTLAFGEKVYHYDPFQAKRKLDSKLSQSMTNLEVQKVPSRPPQSPRKNVYSKTPAFQRLSPIVGSSPEPSQSLSSPSRIPKSSSTPPSRRTSPTRTLPTLAGKPPPSKSSSRTVSRSQSRSQSRNQSRNASRETSPTKNPMSPTRIPVTKYKNVQAKVNTFNKPKPKVPPKPQVLSEQSDESSDVSQLVKNKPILSRKESVNRIRTNSRSKLLPKAEDNSNNINNNTTITISIIMSIKYQKKKTEEKKITDSPKKQYPKPTNESLSEKRKNNNSDSSITAKDTTERRNTNNSNSSSPLKDITESRRDNNSDPALARRDISRKDNTGTDVATGRDAGDISHKIRRTTSSSSEDQQLKKSESPVKLADILPSTTTVVTSTTSTVTQPLKIEANINISKPLEKPKPVSPMVDGRVLSATSVSNAMNKMNDTVLNSQTMFKDHGFTKLSPSANAIMSVANETSKVTNPALDTKNATSALPKLEPVSIKPESVVTDVSNSNRANNHTNHVTHSGFISSKALEMEVQRNMSKLISPEHVVGNSVQKSINDRIKDARTVVAADVKPIRITVKEKPSDAEVQSGNVRLPVSVSNGVNERPG